MLTELALDLIDRLLDQDPAQAKWIVGAIDKAYARSTDQHEMQAMLGLLVQVVQRTERFPKGAEAEAPASQGRKRPEGPGDSTH